MTIYDKQNCTKLINAIIEILSTSHYFLGSGLSETFDFLRLWKLGSTLAKNSNCCVCGWKIIN